MLPDKKVKCPYTGFTKTCFDGVTKHACPKWIHIAGKNPQSLEVFDKYGCADTFLPLIMIENTQMQRQTGAAVESFRNEMVRLNQSPLLPQMIGTGLDGRRLA